MAVARPSGLQEMKCVGGFKFLHVNCNKTPVGGGEGCNSLVPRLSMGGWREPGYEARGCTCMHNIISDGPTCMDVSRLTHCHSGSARELYLYYRLGILHCSLWGGRSINFPITGVWGFEVK